MNKATEVKLSAENKNGRIELRFASSSPRLVETIERGLPLLLDALDALESFPEQAAQAIVEEPVVG